MSLPLYIDEDSMDRDLARALRARGIDVTTALEAGMIRRSDEEQLEYATERQRVLYSFNVGDFCRIHSNCLSAGRTHAGIVLSQQQYYSVGEQMRLGDDEMVNRLEFLGSWGDSAK